MLIDQLIIKVDLLDLTFNVFVEFISTLVEKFDTVIFIRIVTG